MRDEEPVNNVRERRYQQDDAENTQRAPAFFLVGAVGVAGRGSCISDRSLRSKKYTNKFFDTVAAFAARCDQGAATVRGCA
jgi:hypothetical protein